MSEEQDPDMKMARDACLAEGWEKAAEQAKLSETIAKQVFHLSDEEAARTKHAVYEEEMSNASTICSGKVKKETPSL